MSWWKQILAFTFPGCVIRESYRVVEISFVYMKKDKQPCNDKLLGLTGKAMGALKSRKIPQDEFNSTQLGNKNISKAQLVH